MIEFSSNKKKSKQASVTVLCFIQAVIPLWCV